MLRVTAAVAGFVLLTLVLVAVVAVHLARGLQGRDRVAATLAVTLIPTATGTEVSLDIEAEQELPGTLDLTLEPADTGYDDDGDSPLSGARLSYTGVRDVVDRSMPVSGSGTVTGVPTDGHRAVLSFRVARAAGERVVYPVPYSPQLRYRVVTVHARGVTPSCLQSSAVENGRTHFATCRLDPAGTVPTDDGWAPEKLRLEVGE